MPAQKNRDSLVKALTKMRHHVTSLSDRRPSYADLGPDYYASRIDPDRRRRNHVRELEALGYTVILERAA